jgi:hypothetical protein
LGDLPSIVPQFISVPARNSNPRSAWIEFQLERHFVVTYRVKVHGTTFLWGTETTGTPLKGQVYFHFRNSEDGETVAFGWRKGKDKPWKLGNLAAGEAFTIRLEDIVAIWATLDEPMHTYVDCALLIGPSE